MKPRNGNWKESDLKVFDTLCNSLNQDLDVYFVVPEFCRVHA